MNKGKWFLRYDICDTFGGGIGGTWEQKEVSLIAVNQELAMTEADSKWNELVEIAQSEFEKKKNWAHPPRDPFVDGPIKPRLIYKINLKE